MSKLSSSNTESKSSVTHCFSADLNGNNHWGYGGTMPEHISGQQYHNSAGKKKSNVRLNDQLVPKPTDINVAEKIIKIATLKEHPYSSHIPRVAMFPSFRSPDDPETGVRASSQPFPNLLIPNRAPDVTVHSKTIGSPYRHETLETPLKTIKKAVSWTGEDGFLDHTKPLKGENQVFYPTPPKVILPNPKLRDWSLTLSERTSNMLKNLERTLWITSYQMHYTGPRLTNPLKIDDFQEKISNFTGISAHPAPVRQRSHPMSVPSEAKQGWGMRQGSKVERSTFSPTAAGLQNVSSISNQRTIPAIINQHKPQEITAINEAPVSSQMGFSQSQNRTHTSEVQHTQLSQETLHKQHAPSKSSVYEGIQRENGKVRFDETLLTESKSQSNKGAKAAQISNTEQFLDVDNQPRFHTRVNKERSPVELHAKDLSTSKDENLKVGNPPAAKKGTSAESHAGLSSEQQVMTDRREYLHGFSDPCILPRPPALPGIHSADRAGSVGRASKAFSFLELQQSFSKSEAHRNFNNSITRAVVDPRDNVVSGKKHNFYGINCHYIRG